MWQGQWSTVYIYYFAFYSTPSPCVSNSNFYFLTVRYSALSPHSLRWTLSPHLAFAYLRSMLPCPALRLCANVQTYAVVEEIRRSQTASHSVRPSVRPLPINRTAPPSPRPLSIIHILFVAAAARPTNNPQGIRLFSCRVTILSYVHLYMPNGLWSRPENEPMWILSSRLPLM